MRDASIDEDLRESLLLGPARTRAAALRPDATPRTNRLGLEYVGVGYLTQKLLNSL
jgi:hypothetical protein